MPPLGSSAPWMRRCSIHRDKVGGVFEFVVFVARLVYGSTVRLQTSPLLWSDSRQFSQKRTRHSAGLERSHEYHRRNGCAHGVVPRLGRPRLHAGPVAPHEIPDRDGGDNHEQDNPPVVCKAAARCGRWRSGARSGRRGRGRCGGGPSLRGCEKQEGENGFEAAHGIVISRVGAHTWSLTRPS